ncbi:hypothetical protein AAFA46_08400 [Oscillospiraceae bacterium WX1]
MKQNQNVATNHQPRTNEAFLKAVSMNDSKTRDISAEAESIDAFQNAYTDRLFQQIERVQPGHYDFRLDEYNALSERSCDSFSLMISVFKLGFIKGQRAEKARVKKQLGINNDKGEVA